MDSRKLVRRKVSSIYFLPVLSLFKKYQYFVYSKLASTIFFTFLERIFFPWSTVSDLHLNLIHNSKATKLVLKIRTRELQVLLYSFMHDGTASTSDVIENELAFNAAELYFKLSSIPGSELYILNISLFQRAMDTFKIVTKIRKVGMFSVKFAYKSNLNFAPFFSLRKNHQKKDR